MRQVNTGNILPFYKYDALKSENFFNAPTSHFVGGDIRLLPFQLIVPYPAGLFDFDLYNEAGAFLSTLTVTEAENTSATVKIFTFPANVNQSVTNCSRYQIRAGDPSLPDYEYFSEWIYIKTNWAHEITFTNASDIGQVMYQTGYTQKVYFDGYEDTPKTDITTGVEIGLNGLEVITSARQTEKRVLVGNGFLDSQLTALQRIGLHKTITINDKENAETHTVTRLDFTHEPQGDGANTGTFEFIVDTATVEGCGVNTFVL